VARIAENWRQRLAAFERPPRPWISSLPPSKARVRSSRCRASRRAEPPRLRPALDRTPTVVVDARRDGCPHLRARSPPSIQTPPQFMTAIELAADQAEVTRVAAVTVPLRCCGARCDPRGASGWNRSSRSAIHRRAGGVSHTAHAIGARLPSRIGLGVRADDQRRRDQQLARGLGARLRCGLGRIRET